LRNPQVLSSYSLCHVPKRPAQTRSTAEPAGVLAGSGGGLDRLDYDFALLFPDFQGLQLVPGPYTLPIGPQKGLEKLGSIRNIEAWYKASRLQQPP